LGRRAHRRGGFHGGVARPNRNNGEGRRPVEAVDSSRFGNMAGAWEVIGVALVQQEENRSSLMVGGGSGTLAVASVLGIFSQRKLLMLGRPSDREVELTGGGWVMGGAVGIGTVRGGAEQRRGRGGARRRGERRKPLALCTPFIATRGGGRQ
jgi:hypothetical protein